MKKKVLLLLMAVLLVASLVASSCTPAAPGEHEIVTINMLATKAGGSSHIFSFETSRLLEEFHPWLRVAASETPGSLYIEQNIS